MTASPDDRRDDAEANRRHLAALGGGGDTRWRERMKGTTVLGIKWDKLPPEFRRDWLEATDYGERPPPPEFAAWAPQLLAIKQAKHENLQRQIAAETAARRAWLERFPPAPREQCLRTPPCEVRCLRAMLDQEEGSPSHRSAPR